MNYISKQTSYDLAYEIATKAKKVLGLSQYDQETLEHDINNLRAHEWIDVFNMISDSNEVKKLYFTQCVELEDENEQELEEDMEDFNIYLILTDYSVEQYGYYNADDFYDYLDELKKKTDDELFNDEILAYVGMNSDEEVIEYYISNKADADKVRNIVDNGFETENLDEGYSREGYSWDEVNGMIHIYEDGKLIDKYPDMESAEEAGWDLNELNESLDQMREKALEMKENSDAFAILYGYRVKGKEVDLEPEEFMTEKEYKDRIEQITNSLTKYSDKDPRGNRYGYQKNITFYTVYPNKNSNMNESAMVDTLKAKYPTLDNTWNMGSDKTKLNNEEFELLYNLADKLTKNSPNQYKYEVKLTYEDYGAGMKWYNIICYDKRGNSWQVLNTKDWLDLMNTKDIDKIYNQVIEGDWFRDKQKDVKDMNMGELFNHMED